jgi:hypothetical protein
MRAKVFHGPCIGHDNRRSKFGTRSLFAFADVDFHTDSTAALEKNAGELVIGQEFAARRTNYSASDFGDFACSTIRVPRSFKVMRRDHCMSGKRAKACRQSTVCTLRCDDGAKPRIAKTPHQILLRAIPEPITIASYSGRELMRLASVLYKGLKW